MIETDQQLFEEGRRAFEKKDYVKAEKCFTALIKTHKNFADVLNMLGVISHSNGDFTQSIKFFQKALKVNPNYTEALLNLAVLYNDLGKYQKASELYHRVQIDRSQHKKEKVDPFIKNKLANQHAALGDLYQGVGLYPEAILEYEKALNLRPKFLDIRLKLAVSLREEGQYAKSLKTLGEIIRANPKYSQARVQLGVTAYASGDKKKATAAWKDALKLNPKDESAKMYLKLAEEEKKK